MPKDNISQKNFRDGVPNFTEVGSKVENAVDDKPFATPMRNPGRNDLYRMLANSVKGDLLDMLAMDQQMKKELADIDSEPQKAATKKNELPQDGSLDLPNIINVKNAVQADYREANKYSIPQGQSFVKPDTSGTRLHSANPMRDEFAAQFHKDVAEEKKMN